MKMKNGLLAFLLLLLCTLVLFSCEREVCEHKYKLKGRINEVPPTETEEGSYEQIVYCKDCNETLSSEKRTIPRIKCVHKDEDENFYCDKCHEFYVSEDHYHEFLIKDTSDKYLKTDGGSDAPSEYYYSCKCGEHGNRTFSALPK